MKPTKKLLDLLLSFRFKEYEEEYPSVKAELPGHPGVRIEKISKKTVKVIPILIDNSGEVLLEGEESEIRFASENDKVFMQNWIVYQEIEIR